MSDSRGSDQQDNDQKLGTFQLGRGRGRGRGVNPSSSEPNVADKPSHTEETSSGGTERNQQTPERGRGRGRGRPQTGAISFSPSKDEILGDESPPTKHDDSSDSFSNVASTRGRGRGRGRGTIRSSSSQVSLDEDSPAIAESTRSVIKAITLEQNVETLTLEETAHVSKASTAKPEQVLVKDKYIHPFPSTSSGKSTTKPKADVVPRQAPDDGSDWIRGTINCTYGSLKVLDGWKLPRPLYEYGFFLSDMPDLSEKESLKGQKKFIHKHVYDIDEIKKTNKLSSDEEAIDWLLKQDLMQYHKEQLMKEFDRINTNRQVWKQTNAVIITRLSDLLDAIKVAPSVPIPGVVGDSRVKWIRGKFVHFEKVKVTRDEEGWNNGNAFLVENRYYRPAEFRSIQDGVTEFLPVGSVPVSNDHMQISKVFEEPVGTFQFLKHRYWVTIQHDGEMLVKLDIYGRPAHVFHNYWNDNLRPSDVEKEHEKGVKKVLYSYEDVMKKLKLLVKDKKNLIPDTNDGVPLNESNPNSKPGSGGGGSDGKKKDGQSKKPGSSSETKKNETNKGAESSKTSEGRQRPTKTPSSPTDSTEATPHHRAKDAIERAAIECGDRAAKEQQKRRRESENKDTPQKKRQRTIQCGKETSEWCHKVLTATSRPASISDQDTSAKHVLHPVENTPVTKE